MKKEIRKILLENVTISEDKRYRFFKSGVGEYAEHDKFLGITVPSLHKISKSYLNLELQYIQDLLRSLYNEERLLALFILVSQYNKKTIKEEIYQFYLANLQYVNNWNLVDASAHLILGAHLENKSRDLLLELAYSDNLWQRRISIVATWWFIKQNDFIWTVKIARLLLNDKEDLMHKAIGWMLREVGKRDENLLKNFLQDYKELMPRTMLRYAIEKFPLNERKQLLQRA